MEEQFRPPQPSIIFSAELGNLCSWFQRLQKKIKIYWLKSRLSLAWCRFHTQVLEHFIPWEFHPSGFCWIVAAFEENLEFWIGTVNFINLSPIAQGSHPCLLVQNMVAKLLPGAEIRITLDPNYRNLIGSHSHSKTTSFKMSGNILQ